MALSVRTGPAISVVANKLKQYERWKVWGILCSVVYLLIWQIVSFSVGQIDDYLRYWGANLDWRTYLLLLLMRRGVWQSWFIPLASVFVPLLFFRLKDKYSPQCVALILCVIVLGFYIAVFCAAAFAIGDIYGAVTTRVDGSI